VTGDTLTVGATSGLAIVVTVPSITFTVGVAIEDGGPLVEPVIVLTTGDTTEEG
jgi:hypothetical protein